MRKFLERLFPALQRKEAGITNEERRKMLVFVTDVNPAWRASLDVIQERLEIEFKRLDAERQAQATHGRVDRVARIERGGQSGSDAPGRAGDEYGGCLHGHLLYQRIGPLQQAPASRWAIAPPRWLHGLAFGLIGIAIGPCFKGMAVLINFLRGFYGAGARATATFAAS